MNVESNINGRRNCQGKMWGDDGIWVKVKLKRGEFMLSDKQTGPVPLETLDEIKEGTT